MGNGTGPKTCPATEIEGETPPSRTSHLTGFVPKLFHWLMIRNFGLTYMPSSNMIMMESLD